MARAWTLQIVTTTWVLWGYGPGRQVVHVDRAVLDLAGIELEFELPAHEAKSSLPPAEEYERRTCVGWRFLQADSAHTTDWKLVDSIDQAKEAAGRFAESYAEQHPHRSDTFRDALKRSPLIEG